VSARVHEIVVTPGLAARPFCLCPLRCGSTVSTVVLLSGFVSNSVGCNRII
jgi:hypothetical protein